MRKNLIIWFISIPLIFSACGDRGEQASMDSSESGLSVEQFKMSMAVSKDLYEEQEISLDEDDVAKVVFLGQLQTVALAQEAEKRGISVSEQEVLEHLEESEKAMPEDYQELYEKQVQKSADYFGISLEQYREDYLLSHVQKTILQNKLREEIIPHDSQEELMMLIPEWDAFVYDSVLSYVEKNKEEVEQFKEEIGLDYDIQRSDFVSRETFEINKIGN